MMTNLKLYKKQKRHLRHFLYKKFNLYTRKMSLKSLKYFYKSFNEIQAVLDNINGIKK